MTFSAHAASRGITGQPAPAWNVEKWFNTGSIAKRLDIFDKFAEEETGAGGHRTAGMSSPEL